MMTESLKFRIKSALDQNPNEFLKSKGSLEWAENESKWDLFHSFPFSEACNVQRL